MPTAIITDITATPIARRSDVTPAGGVTTRRVPPVLHGYQRPFIFMELVAHQPGANGTPPRVITGRLLGAMYNHGAVHHFRISGADGVCYFVPPAWLTHESAALATAAMDSEDSYFLSICRQHGTAYVFSLIRQVTNTPADLSDEDAMAWLEARQECEA